MANSLSTVAFNVTEVLGAIVPDLADRVNQLGASMA